MRGLLKAILVFSILSLELLGGRNIGLTKEIDNRRECLLCEFECSPSEEKTEITLGYLDSFWVDEQENVYLLETYANRVLEVSQKDIKEIFLSDTVLPADIVCTGEKLVVFDDLLSEIQVYSKQGELLNRREVSLKGDYVRQLYGMREEVFLLTYKGSWYQINPETGELLQDKEKVFVPPDSGDYSYAEYVDTDEDGTVYSVYTSLAKSCSVISGELILRGITKEGEQKGVYLIPAEEYTYLPDRYVQVHPNGNVYLMVTSDQSVQVKKVALKEYEESKLTTITDAAKKLEREYTYDSNYRVKADLSCTATVAYSRAEVRERAEAMVQYEWTLKKTNANSSKWEKDVVLPRELAYIKKINAEKESWSAKVTGIPYCWGGFYALDTGFSGKTFPEAIKDGYVAGNINPVGYYKYKSAGVDCSGFVGGAFGFTKKYNTGALSDIGTRVKNPQQLQEMDILVYPGEHIMFFCEWLDEATMLVCESAVREGKVMLHPKPVNEFVINGAYQMRSPW